MSIGIIVDTSPSMTQTTTREVGEPKKITDAISRFIELGNEKNEYFLAEFDSTFRLLSDWTDGKSLMASKPSITSQGKTTVLYDACTAAVDKLTSGHYEKRVLILFSDGLDGESKTKYGKLRDSLRRSDVLLYGVGPRLIFGNLPIPLTIFIKEGSQVLGELADTTGGKAFIPETSSQFVHVVEQIAIELRHQYWIGFHVPEAAQPNQWRRVKVKVTAPPAAPIEFKKLTVRARQGYYTG